MGGSAILHRAMAAATILAACACAPAMAATSYTFSLPSKPVSEALIAVALQARVSIGGAAVCTGQAPALAGRLSMEAALDRILAGSGCTYRRIDDQTFRIVRAAAPKPPPAPPAQVRTTLRTEPRIEPRPAPSLAPRTVDPVEDVIITSARRPTFSDHFPGAASVLSGEELARSGAADTSDIFGQLAGVSMTNLGPGRDKIMLRGLSDGTFTGRTQSTVGIYLDKAPITYNAPDPNLRLADVSGVELLRGPQGSLYGGGSISGIYRIVPRSPQLNQFSGAVLVGGSTTKSGDPSGEAEATLNLPLKTDRAALRAVIYSDVQGGYIDDVNLRLSNVDRTSRVGGRLSALALVGDDWTLTAGGAYQRIDAKDTQYVTPASGRLHRSNEIREGNSNEFSLVSLSLDGKRPWGNISIAAAAVSNVVSTRSDASRALPLFGFSTPAVGAHDREIDSDLLTLDVTVTSPGGGRGEWLVGAFATAGREQVKSDVLMNATAAFPAFPVYQERRSDHRKEFALYGEYSYALRPKLKLTAGLRVSRAMVSTTSIVTGFPALEMREFNGDAHFTGMMPKLALQYEPRPSTVLYVQASAGRRLGGFNTAGPIDQVFLTLPGGPGPYRRFEPDELRNYEAGVKARLARGRLRFRAAAFYVDWKNIQTDQYLISGLSYTANAGDGRNIGVEGELAIGPVKGLELQLNGILNQPELTSPSIRFPFPTRQHIGLPGVPDVSGGGRLSYERPLSRRFTAMFAIQGQYIGRSRPTFDPSSAKMGGYVLARLSAAIYTPRWSLALNLDNPTDETGDTFSYGNPFNFRSTREMTPQRPRTLQLRLQTHF